MNPKNRFYFFSLVAVMTLLINLALPINAFADDATPPPAATEEPAQPPTDPNATEEPATQPADPIATEAPVQPPTDPVATEAPAVSSTQEAAPTENDTTVVEVLDQLPDDTQVVVLNEQGETVPLASQEAAAILETGDPIWCPGSALPGDATCTPIKTNFTGTATDGLVRFLANNESKYFGSGTIYVTSSLSSADTTAGAINLFADAPNLDKLTNLTIQGGWNGLTGGSFGLSGQSNFDATTLRIGTAAVPWNGNVTINDIAFSGVTSGNSLTVFTNGDSITLNNVDVINQAGNFSSTLLTSTSGDITVQGNSTFDGDASVNSKGFTAETTGSITIKDTTFSETTNPLDKRNGATLTASTVKLDTVYATNNALNGIKINNATDVTLNDVFASGNGSDGAKIANSGNVTVADSIFHDNGNNGINITASGLVQLNNDTSYANSWNGANLDLTGDVSISGGSYHDNDRRGILAQSDGGDFLIQDAQLTGNGFAGLYAEMLSINDFTLDHVVLDGNGNYGAYLDTLGNIFVQGGSQFTNNAAAGLYIAQTNDLNIYDDITYGSTIFSNNDGHGLYAENIYADVSIDNATFEKNGINGLYLPSVDGTTTITGSDFFENIHNGALLGDSCGCTQVVDVFINSSDFSDNGSDGLDAYSGGNIDLTDVTANGNDDDGAYLDNCDWDPDFFVCLGSGNITISGTSTFNNNGENGVEAYSVGGINLEDVTASENDEVGASLFAAGDISLTTTGTNNNVFENNGSHGLLAITEGKISLQNVLANENGYDGAHLNNGCGCTISNIIIETSNFNNNDGNGLEAYSFGNITLNSVIANGNGGNGVSLFTVGDVSIDPSEFSYNDDTGVYLEINGNAKICDTTIINNNDVGVDASNVAETLTMGNVTLSGNNPNYIYSGSVSDCNPSSGGGGGKKGSQTGSIIPVTGGQEVTCEVDATSTTFELPSGDQVTLPCPINDFAFVNPIVENGLPGSFGDGNHFLSALNANVIRDSQTVQSLEEPMTVSFIIPDGIKADGLAIMLWDGTQWVKLDGKVSADGLHFEVITKSTGTFALVNK